MGLATGSRARMVTIMTIESLRVLNYARVHCAVVHEIGDILGIVAIQVYHFSCLHYYHVLIKQCNDCINNRL